MKQPRPLVVVSLAALLVVQILALVYITMSKGSTPLQALQPTSGLLASRPSPTPYMPSPTPQVITHTVTITEYVVVTSVPVVAEAPPPQAAEVQPAYEPAPAEQVAVAADLPVVADEQFAQVAMAAEAAPTAPIVMVPTAPPPPPPPAPTEPPAPTAAPWGNQELYPSLAMGANGFAAWWDASGNKHQVSLSSSTTNESVVGAIVSNAADIGPYFCVDGACQTLGVEGGSVGSISVTLADGGYTISTGVGGFTRF